jgi:cytochrome c biogenesis protein CcmG/thiol:disulfide interchange protein DsbE
MDYGVYGAPESFLIDKNGVIRFKQIGPITDEVWNSKILPLARELNK